MVGLLWPGTGQAGYVLPSPTLAAPSSGRLLPAASGSPGRGRRRGQRPPLMPALLAPHTARSSRAPCVRRPSAGGRSCGCTWCPTRGRCPTRSGAACPRDPSRRARSLPGVVAGASYSAQPLPPTQCPPHFWVGPEALISFQGRQAWHPRGYGSGGLPGASFTPGQGAPQHLGLGPAPRHHPTAQRWPGPWVQAASVTDCGPAFQCSSCSQQFMQKKDLQSHMIKLHGAPKPHAVSARLCQEPGGHTL